MVVLMTRTLGLAGAVVALSASIVWAWNVQAETQKADVQTVEIAAERFSFTPSEVKTRVGRTVTFKLTSDDTDHGFRIIGTSVNVEIPKRGRGAITVSFTPEKPGRYTFECSKLCGAGHGFMRGILIVDDAAKGER
jgi:cytochrome c oxidase subunit 2